jgi:xanthine dehydrogenase YagR molybdenum-binding subunit
VLPAVVGMQAAIKPGAPLVYASKKDAKEAPAASEGPVFPSSFDGNLRGPMSASQLARPKAARKGVDDANASGKVGGGVFRTAVQVHTALEPHAAVARWPTADSVELWASTQSVTWLAEDVADRFDVDRNKVQVHAPYVGGGFGAKVGLQVEALAAIELARQTNAPVRVALDRVEELTVGGNRPATQIEIAVGMAASGSLMGVTQTAYSDAGCAVGSNVSFLTRLQYDTTNKDLDDYDIVTHGPPGRPMRGPGGPPAFFALESAVDQIAAASGEDPIAVRQRWDPNVARTKLYEWALSLPVWQQRGPVGADTGRYRRGVGLAAGAWLQFWDPHTQVELEIGPSGIVARCACQDTGQGTRTVIATTVAEALGVDVKQVAVEIGDSRFPHGPASAGSRSTSSLVPAAQDAAQKLIAELVDLATERGIGTAAGQGGIQGATAVVPWTEVVAGTSGIKVVGRRRRDERAALLPIAFFDSKVGRVFPGIVNITQIEVDTRLGRVRVLEGWAGVGVGRIVSEPLARSQILGSFVQNVGYALYEERRLDPTTGRLLTHNLDDYRIPGIGDSAPLTVWFEPAGFEHVRGGAVGLGEIGGVAVAGSIANAFFHATGKRPYQLPLKPQTVLEVLS